MQNLIELLKAYYILNKSHEPFENILSDELFCSILNKQTKGIDAHKVEH